jgi:hypothetical protein
MNLTNPKLNAEGYYDPTAFEALSAVRREEKAKARTYRPLVYICSPFAGDPVRNTERARQYCRFAVSQGAIPFAPHLLYPQFMDEADPKQRALGLFFGKVWLGKCDALWCFGAASEGMKQELGKARRRGISIRFFNEQCEEVCICSNP